jgi:hypothetical protein
VTRLTVLRLTHELFVSLNVGFSAAYGFLTYLHTWPGEPVGRKLIASIDDTFHISKNSIVVSNLRSLAPCSALLLHFFFWYFSADSALLHLADLYSTSLHA